MPERKVKKNESEKYQCREGADHSQVRIEKGETQEKIDYSVPRSDTPHRLLHREGLLHPL
jgi:hypothetical protein